MFYEDPRFKNSLSSRKNESMLFLETSNRVQLPYCPEAMVVGAKTWTNWRSINNLAGESAFRLPNPPKTLEHFIVRQVSRQTGQGRLCFRK